MSTPTASEVLRLGGAAAGRQRWLVAPLFAAELCAALVGLVPTVFVTTRVLAKARWSGAHEPAGALAIGTLETLLDPSTWLVLGTGSLLAAAGGWLVRTLVHAGSLGALAATLHGTGRGDLAFARALLDHPERWLAAGALSSVLRFFALLCGIGTVAAGMAWFQSDPGPLAALGMTIATALVVALPYLAAALEVGFARAVLLGEGPGAALGGGLLLAARRYRTLVPAWATFVLLELAISIVLGVALGTVGAVPAPEGLWILLLGPRAFLWGLGALALAGLHAWRLGAWAALVTLDARPALAADAVPPRVPHVAATETVYDAIAIEEPAPAPPQDDTPPRA